MKTFQTAIDYRYFFSDLDGNVYEAVDAANLEAAAKWLWRHGAHYYRKIKTCIRKSPSDYFRFWDVGNGYLHFESTRFNQRSNCMSTIIRKAKELDRTGDLSITSLCEMACDLYFQQMYPDSLAFVSALKHATRFLDMPEADTTFFQADLFYCTLKKLLKSNYPRKARQISSDYWRLSRVSIRVPSYQDSVVEKILKGETSCFVREKL